MDVGLQQKKVQRWGTTVVKAKGQETMVERWKGGGSEVKTKGLETTGEKKVERQGLTVVKEWGTTGEKVERWKTTGVKATEWKTTREKS